LTESQLNEISGKFIKLNTIPSSLKKLSRTALWMILVKFYFKYLPQLWQVFDRRLPNWLYKLCGDIIKKETCELDVDELLHLSGKNHSYLCRTFRKYLNLTPTQCINQIRLDYAENFLMNTDLSITGICYETGFKSLSHFYNLLEQ
jgi:AraC family transcriptional regulator, dual regulator of chb operon